MKKCRNDHRFYFESIIRNNLPCFKWRIFDIASSTCFHFTHRLTKKMNLLCPFNFTIKKMALCIDLSMQLNLILVSSNRVPTGIADYFGKELFIVFMNWWSQGGVEKSANLSIGSNLFPVIIPQICFSKENWEAADGFCSYKICWVTIAVVQHDGAKTQRIHFLLLLPSAQSELPASSFTSPVHPQSAAKIIQCGCLPSSTCRQT